MHLLSFNHILPTGGKQTQMGQASTRVPSSKSPSHTSRRPEEGGGFGRAPFTHSGSHRRLRSPREGYHEQQRPKWPRAPECGALRRLPKRGTFREPPAALPGATPSIAARGGSGQAAADGHRQSFRAAKRVRLAAGTARPHSWFSILPTAVFYSRAQRSESPTRDLSLQRRSPRAAVDTDTRGASSPLYFSIGAAAGAPRRSGTRRCPPRSAPLRRSPPAHRRHRIPARAAPPRPAPRLRGGEWGAESGSRDRPGAAPRCPRERCAPGALRDEMEQPGTPVPGTVPLL